MARTREPVRTRRVPAATGASLRSLPLLALTLLFCASGVVQSQGTAAQGEGRIWVAGSCFHDLGEDEDGTPLRGYPHREGIVEIFRQTKGAGVDDLWAGDLGSCFDANRGTFPVRFATADLLEDLAEAGASSARKDRSAQLLTLFLEEWRVRHGADAAPFYLQRYLSRIAGRIDRKDVVAIEEQRVWRGQVFAAFPDAGVASVETRFGDYRDYHAALIEDGYLDLAIVVGNAFDRKTEKYRSRELVEDLHAALEKLGFRRVSPPRGESPDATIDVERTVRILGRRVRVRARITGGARLFPHIRHAVANFVEGVANADVVLYHGHSNRGSAYFIAENHDRWSSFDIGKGGDLETKCYGLKEKPYQIFVLQSCESYDRYCRPMRRRLAEETEYTTRPGVSGFIGTADLTYYEDLPPRLVALLEGLIAGAAPRAIERSLRDMRPHPDTPPLIVRGLLQPTGTFIVPAPVGGGDPIAIVEARERGAKLGHRIEGKSGDGAVWFDTSIFPQDTRGEVVQIVEGAGVVFGLYADGTVSRVGKATQGAAVPAVEESDVVPRFRHMGAFGRGSGKSRVRLVAEDGAVHLAAVDGSKLERTEMGPSSGQAFVALGMNRDKQVIAIDTTGQQFLWSHLRRKWVEPEEELTLDGFPPHLGGVGVKGVLVGRE